MDIFQETNELQDRKGMLLAEILDLESQKKELDKIVKTHQGKTIKDKSLDDSIAEKRKTLEDLNTEINPLADQKALLEKQCSDIEYSIEQKQSLSVDIIKYKSMLKILQKEVNDFEVLLDNKKTKSENVLTDTTDKLNTLYVDIKNILDSLK